MILSSLNRKTKIIAVAFAVLLIGLGMILLLAKNKSNTTVQPEPAQANIQPVKEQLPTPEPPKELPAQFSQDVPFTSQAPHANWDALHEETCEEASLLMADRHFSGQTIASPDDAEAALQEVIAWQKQKFGYFESTTAEQTAQIAREFYGLQTEIINNPTIEQLKSALNEKKLVIVPAAGRELGNPNYKPPGPLYHMFVIIGYTPSHFITNDPGTRLGKNYEFSSETVLFANQDWGGNGSLADRKPVIVVWQ